MKFLHLLSYLILFKSFLCHGEESVGASSNGTENCGGTFSGFQYTILSPNYPKNYPASKDCVFTLKGSELSSCDQEFHLQFLDFQIEASKGCVKDYVKIGTGNIYCGNSVGIRKFSGQPENSLKVIFHSDNNATSKGFKILVTTLSCNNSNKSNSTASARNDFSQDTATTGQKENLKNSYPVFIPPGVTKFDVEDDARGDQPPSRIQNQVSAVKNPPAEELNLELPGFQQQHVHDKNCGHGNGANADGIGSITSYLYLPPSSVTKPLKINGVKTPASNPVPDMESETVPIEIAIKEFQDEPLNLDVTDPPTDLLVPYHQIPPPFVTDLIPQTRKTFQPLKSHHNNHQSYDSTNRWITYGTPNSVPSIPTDNFDPFSNNNNNNNPGVNYNPLFPNCGGNSNNPNNNNFNPGEGLSPYYPNTNFGNGNVYPDIDNNFDMSFGVLGGNNNNNNNNNNPGYFPVNGHYYPNNNFYGIDDTVYYGNSLSECCGTRYSGGNFMIASPGFPALIYSSSSYECQYTIVRASENVCQLQMYLKFFNFGSEDQFCAYGYIEIDGNRLCGCKTGVNITSSFDNIATKIINVKYLGYPRIKFSGFVIEVTQVSCSTSYFRLRNYQQGQQNPTFVKSYQRNYKRSTTANVETEEGSSAEESYKGKRDLGYFYQRPENSAALTTSQNLFLNSCRLLKFINWVKAAKQVYLQSAQCSRGTVTNGVSSTISVIPIFPDTGSSALINYPSTSSCEAVNVVQGTISSPYYPNSYSNNVNQCYRFFKAPGYCQLELAILDFDLENSTICRKDYVAFSGQKRRYCGTSLAGSRTIFDMTRSTFADLYFVTDSSGTGRGFRAGFTQISC